MLHTSAGLQVSLDATGLANPRLMALGPHGDVFVGSWSNGTVSVLVNRNGSTRASQSVTLLSGLTVPQSVAYRNGLLYVAEEGQVSTRSHNFHRAGRLQSTRDRLRIAYWRATYHALRSARRRWSLYVSVGSSCNECVDYANRAVIMHYRADGSGGQTYASGLRNAVGLAVQPGTGRLWAVDNGQDLLGDNIPPDEVDLIRQSGNYGWPYCWGNGQKDPSVSSVAGYCSRTINPAVSLQAHSAPLGAAFYTGKLLPAIYRGGLFIAYHGSESRSQPTGRRRSISR